MKRPWIAAFLCITGLFTCPSARLHAASSTLAVTMSPEADRCEMPSGWDAVAARNARFVVFGELHGTQQAPAFIGDVACALAERGERVLVAVEHASEQNAAFQRAWKLAPAEFPEALERAGWALRDDGVGSEAMLDLLVRLHRLAKHGRLIDIVAFNSASNEAQRRRFSDLPGQGPHDAAQAENIRIAAEAHPYDHVLVLVGNIHARKRTIAHAGTTFEPMAMRLEAPLNVVALDMRHAGGTAWNCQLKLGVTPGPSRQIVSDDIVCGSFPLRDEHDFRRPPFMALGALPEADIDPAYDGIFWLGRVSASPQAVTMP